MTMPTSSRRIGLLLVLTSLTTGCFATSAANVSVSEVEGGKVPVPLEGTTPDDGAPRDRSPGGDGAADAPSTTERPPASTPMADRGRVVIHAVGDVNLDPDYVPELAERGYDDPFSSVADLFTSDDITIVNLECTPSRLGASLGKRFEFRCPPEALPSLATAGVEVANLGNNHSGDFGPEALVDGIAQVRAAGVTPVGAGADATEAAAPALFTVEGWTVAVVGFGGIFPAMDWSATATRPGMADGDDIASMVATVRAADEVADIVVVTVHWGTELATEPDADDVERAAALVEAGADAIVGHHSHRLQALELVGNRPVAWSLGNFVWPVRSVASSTTAIARVVIEPDGTIIACLLPATIVRHGHPMLDDAGVTTCPSEG